MMAQPDGIWFACPHCGAANYPSAEVCFLCRQRIDPARAEQTGEAKPTPSSEINPYAPPAAAGAAFQLNSLLLVIALIAVCMGVIHEAPGLGVPLAILSFIALGRTVLLSTTRRDPRAPSSIGDKLAVFFATIGVAILVFVCVGIALFAALWAMCAVGNAGFVGTSDGATKAVGALVIAIAAIVGLIYLARRLSRVRSLPRRQK
jgi:hypothetical protein